MKSKYNAKKRNAYNRQRKRFILIAAEGNNKTESFYFRSVTDNMVKLFFVAGNETDPVKMAKHLLKDYSLRDMDAKIGDKAFCVIDADLSFQKEKQIFDADRLIGKKAK